MVVFASVMMESLALISCNFNFNFLSRTKKAASFGACKNCMLCLVDFGLTESTRTV